MQLQEFASRAQDGAGHWLRVLDSSPMLKWGLFAAVWLVIAYRMFGRGVGQSRGIFSWYDWAVLAFGTSLFYVLQFGARVPWD